MKASGQGGGRRNSSRYGKLTDQRAVQRLEKFGNDKGQSFRQFRAQVLSIVACQDPRCHGVLKCIEKEATPIDLPSSARTITTTLMSTYYMQC